MTAKKHFDIKTNVKILNFFHFGSPAPTQSEYIAEQFETHLTKSDTCSLPTNVTAAR
jgi:hypothetical protein